MAVYDLEEQEQLDELKTWWKQYGNLVTNILVVVALAAAGWQGWNWYQRNQSAQASAVYSLLQQASMQRDGKRVKDLAGELVDKYSGTAYAGMGALVSARVQLESGDAKTARAQLAWAAENAFDQGMRDLARLRLAVILVDENSLDEALKILAKEPGAAFRARYAEVRGDILLAQGKPADAKSAYGEAQKSVDDASKTGGADTTAARAAYREIVRSKLESLAGTPAGGK